MKLDYNDTLLMSRERDLMRLLAIALNKLGGSMEIKAEDYFSIRDKTFFSTRDRLGVGKISIVDDTHGKAF